MKKHIGTAFAAIACVALMQTQASAQSADQLQPQSPQLQPEIPATPDGALRGPVSAQGSQPAPFSSSSSYSYRDAGNPAVGGFDPAASMQQPGNPLGAQMGAPMGAPMGGPMGSAMGAPMQGGDQPGGMAPFSSKPHKGFKSSKTPKSQKMSNHKHGFSPVGAVFGLPDRAVKSSLGLTDRTAKAGLGVTGKSTKEVFKAVF
ncbi:MAG TPA: hypothetical protein V6C76_12580 [Drouetiella sp.]